MVGLKHVKVKRDSLDSKWNDLAGPRCWTAGIVSGFQDTKPTSDYPKGGYLKGDYPTGGSLMCKMVERNQRRIMDRASQELKTTMLLTRSFDDGR